MATLPPEILIHLASFLQNDTLKAFRLGCRIFASIGEEHLFNNFEFRLYADSHRIYQLKQLALNPSLAKKLKCVSFESGILLEYADYRYWQAQVYQELSSSWSRSLAAKGASRDEYEQFHEGLQARFTTELAQKYNLYRWHLDQKAVAIAKDHVINTISCHISRLQRINPDFVYKIIMSEPQISLEELENFDAAEHAIEKPEDPDPRRRVSIRRFSCLKHFRNFLDAAVRSDGTISRLVVADVPHQLFGDESQHPDSLMRQVFRNLKELDIKVGSFPHSDWLSRHESQLPYQAGRNQSSRSLRMLLNVPSSLERLRLEFPQGKEAEYSYDLFDQLNLDRFPRLWSPHLQSLQLCRIRSRWNDLKVLLRESKSLTSLTLTHCRLETGSMIDLLHFIPSLALQHVSIHGSWYVDEDSGDWHSHDRYDFTDCYAATSYEGPYAHLGLRSKLEDFMLHGGECPLPKWTPMGKEEDYWEISGDTSWHFLPGLPR